MPRKQHRRGRKTSRKIANLEAILQSMELEVPEGPVEFCWGCEAELTSADYEAEECTQCHTKIRRIA